MALDQDWQLEIPDRSIRVGAGTVYDIPRDGGGLKGFVGLPPARRKDLERHLAHGSVPGHDTYADRPLTIPIGITGTGITDAERQVDAMVKARALLVAWRLATTGELRLDARLPGMPETVLSYFGRPRDVGEVDWTWTFGRLHLTAEFDALDPVAYGATQELDTQSGTFNVTGTGEIDSDRLVLTFHGSGGTPRLVNNTTGGDIRFRTTLAGTAIVDVRAQTCTVGGINHIGDIATSTKWLGLAGGVTNSLTLTGATSVDLTWRAGYQ